MLKRKKRRSREYKNSNQVISIEEARQERKRKRAEAAKKNKIRKTKHPVTQRHAVKKARHRMVYFFITLFIIGIIGVSVFNIINLKLTKARVLEEQQELLEQKAMLESIYSRVSSPEYIEQQARHQLKMIKPEEILYVLPDKDDKENKGGIVPN
ncbi:MAG: septum formation initiator family protein [Eubacteriales bacterium]|nr:septum formation initiator family protein [Eubacteriales bacterium]